MDRVPAAYPAMLWLVRDPSFARLLAALFAKPQSAALTTSRPVPAES